MQAHSQKKIRDYQNNDTISAMVHNWCVLLGINEPPSDHQKSTITAFLKRQFASLSVEDITLSLELAAAHKLGVDPKHYQTLSIEYFGRILSAYKDYLAEEIRHGQQNNVLPQLPPGEQDQRDKERESWEALQAHYEKHGMPVGWDWDKAYWHLENTGQVNESDDWLKRFRANTKERWGLESLAVALAHRTGQREYRMKKYCQYKLTKGQNAEAVSE